MKKREIKSNVFCLPCVDWHRRLFDSLIPLPDGTSYNAYLVRGNEKTALIDTADPAMLAELMSQLSDVDKIDYIISNHSEQDHSGLIPNLKVEILTPVLCKGLPREPDFTALSGLAETIAVKHKELKLK